MHCSVIQLVTYCSSLHNNARTADPHCRCLSCCETTLHACKTAGLPTHAHQVTAMPQALYCQCKAATPDHYSSRSCSHTPRQPSKKLSTAISSRWRTNQTQLPKLRAAGCACRTHAHYVLTASWLPYNWQEAAGALKTEHNTTQAAPP